MAKIIYAIQSDGLGHYSRSKLIIDHLISIGHDVLILTSGRAYDLMQKKYNVEKIGRINFEYENNRVNYLQTIQYNLYRTPLIVKNGYIKINKIFDNFKPDLAIIDFETFTAQTAIRKGVPIIYIDNINAIIRTRVSEDLKKSIHRIFAKMSNIVNLQTPNSKHVKKFIITTFFKTKVKKNKKAIIIPPLIREEIIKAKNTKQKDHILVYQTTSTNKNLLSTLQKLPNEKFIVYGFDKNKKDKNVRFKKTSVKNDFIEDLTSAKAIITNGGHSLITEGIFLQKPILSNPVVGQFEQILNATQVEKLRYGRYTKKITPDSIKSFLYDFKFYKQNLENYKQKDNSAAFEIIDKEIKGAIK